MPVADGGATETVPEPPISVDGQREGAGAGRSVRAQAHEQDRAGLRCGERALCRQRDLGGPRGDGAVARVGRHVEVRRGRVVGGRVLGVVPVPRGLGAADAGGGAAPELGRVVADAHEGEDDVARGEFDGGGGRGRAAARAPRVDGTDAVVGRDPRLAGALLEDGDHAGADVRRGAGVPGRVGLGAVVLLVPDADLHGAGAVAGAGGAVSPLGQLGPARDAGRDGVGLPRDHEDHEVPGRGARGDKERRGVCGPDGPGAGGPA